MEIALATSDDRAVMRVIAILTTVFLPLTTVTTFFGMAFIDGIDSSRFHVSERMWLFVAIAIPLAMLTLGTW